MNRTFKKLISLITTLTMCTSIVGIINVSAADGFSGSGTENDPYLIKTVDDNGATQEEFTSDEGAYLLNNSGTYANSAVERPLTVEYMGMGTAPTATGKPSASLTSDDVSSSTTDKPFWIGLAVEKVNDMDLFTNGVYSLEVAFEYDPDYIKPVIGSGDLETRWHDEIVAANVGSGKAWNEKYTVVSVADTDPDTESDRADKSLSSRSDWRMCVVCITLEAENETDLRFKGLDAADKQYLLNIPFRLIGVPLEGASDMNPTVLSLVRGPETFNIGSGKTGESPKAKWNDKENQNDAENLKTYFKYPKDISLFGSGASITDIMPFRVEDQLDENGNPKKDGDGKVLTEEKEYKLSQNKNLQDDGFNAELTSDPHYRSFSNLPDKVQLRITADDEPTVTVNSTPVTVEYKDGKYITAPFSINELDKTVNGGFNNTIIVQDSGGSTKYTLNFRRLLQPRIELMPGNSPYGMIERMSKKYKGDAGWTDEHITKAKEKFVDASNGAPAMRFRFKDVNITLDDGSIVPAKPDDVETNITYWSFAWDTNEKAGKTITDEKVNMDLSDTAIFVYVGEDYIDSGFTAYDSLGNKVDSTLVTRTVSVDKMTGHDVNLMDKATSFTLTDKTGTAEGNRLVDLKNIYVKPDVYQMEYTFTDPVTSQDYIIKRPIIMLWELGDADLSYSFNPTDATYLTQRLKNFVNPLNKLNNGVIGEERVKGQARCIYTFRIADADNAGSINSTDITYIRQAQKKFVNKIKFYKPVKVINN